MPPDSGCQEVRFPGFPISESVKGPETIRLSGLFQNVRPSKVQFRFPNRQFGEAAAVLLDHVPEYEISEGKVRQSCIYITRYYATQLHL